jgi:hypothetical protein
VSDRLTEIEERKERALADGSFYLRVPTWLTAGDGRDFCAAAPDDIEYLLAKLAKAKAALEFYSETPHWKLKEIDHEWTNNGLRNTRLLQCGVKAREALKELGEE